MPSPLHAAARPEASVREASRKELPAVIAASGCGRIRPPSPTMVRYIDPNGHWILESGPFHNTGEQCWLPGSSPDVAKRAARRPCNPGCRQEDSNKETVEVHCPRMSAKRNSRLRFPSSRKPSATSGCSVPTKMLRCTATPTRFTGVSPKSGSPPQRLRRPMSKTCSRSFAWRTGTVSRCIRSRDVAP